MIEIKNVFKSFKDNHVLKGVDLEVKKGEVVVIVGPSGSGKTTFLRCINFLDQADKGVFSIADRTVDVQKATQDDILNYQRKTAMVFQNYALFTNKTAKENITLPLILTQKKSEEEANQIAIELLENVDLLERQNYYPNQLSGGQQQRIGIARALALQPEVILFDEPTSALDPELVGQILSIIKEIAEKGATMILVTHEMKFAYEVADKVVFMEKGNVVEQGTPDQIFNHPKEKRTEEFLQRFNRVFSFED